MLRLPTTVVVITRVATGEIVVVAMVEGTKSSSQGDLEAVEVATPTPTIGLRV